MHSLNPRLCHCDLKSPNILVKSIDFNSECCAKVADFGLTQNMLTEKLRGRQASNRHVANPTWLAPEVLKGINFILHLLINID
jgi:serine/threonine protein kinase